MNIETLKLLKERVLTLRHNDAPYDDAEANKDRFNMGVFFHKCGTAACLAGHALAMKGNPAKWTFWSDYDEILRDACAMLDIDDCRWAKVTLFMPDSARLYGEATPEQGAYAIQKVIDAGDKYTDLTTSDLWPDYFDGDGYRVTEAAA